jgi:heptosyltransferase-2
MTPQPVLVLAPNWLGDAVMALPAIVDLRRHFSGRRLIVAARSGVADLLRMADGVDDVVPVSWRGSWLSRTPLQEDAARLRAVGASVAVLLPNSFASAWLASRAGITERWGYAADLRTRLLTRAVPRPRGRRHQGEYYQHLVHELGCENGPLAPLLRVSEDGRDEARALLLGHGWDGRAPLVSLAPGAAFGTAKQWLPSRVAALIDTLAAQGVTCVLLGSRADAATTRAIRGVLSPAAAARTVDLAGLTSLAQLAGVLAVSRACVSNDSGAMHVAAALGTPVVATFGPTIVEETRPLVAPGGWARVVTADVWCRPCMLRECPLDHRCMSGISVDMVRQALDAIPSGFMSPGSGA